MDVIGLIPQFGSIFWTIAAFIVALSIIVAAVEEEVRSTACQPGAAIGCTGTSARCLTHRLWSDLDRHIEDWMTQRTLEDVTSQVEIVRA